MKIKALLPVLAILLAVLTSCKKDSKPELIAGKWYEVKLNMYETEGTSARLYETTYLQPFTTLDYVQVNANGTLVSSTDHYYYINMPGQQKAAPQAITQQTATWNYTAAGSRYILKPQIILTDYSGFNSTDTMYVIHNDTLFWHSVLYPPTGDGQTVNDLYFVK